MNHPMANSKKFSVRIRFCQQEYFNLFSDESTENKKPSRNIKQNNESRNKTILHTAFALCPECAVSFSPCSLSLPLAP